MCARHCTERRILRLYGHHFAFNCNRLSLCANLQVSVQHFGLRHGNGHRRNLNRLETAGFDLDFVISRRQQAEPVRTVGPGHVHSRRTGVNTREGYRGIGNYGAGRVFDRARQSARASRLGAQRLKTKQGYNKKQNTNVPEPHDSLLFSVVFKISWIV